MSPDCGDHGELGKSRADTGRGGAVRPVREGEAGSAGESTVAACGGGSARSSGEASVIGVERRGRPIDDVRTGSTVLVAGRIR